MKTIQEEKRTRQKAKGNGNGRSSPKGGERTEEKLLSIPKNSKDEESAARLREAGGNPEDPSEAKLGRNF